MQQLSRRHDNSGKHVEWLFGSVGRFPGEQAMSRSSSSNTTTQPSVDELVTRYRNMVTAGRALAPMAAENLDYWLSGRGGTKVIPAHHFQNDSAVTSHLRSVHRNVFLSTSDRSKGIIPRLQRQPVSTTYQMTWEDSTYARPLSDLFFGLGGFTVKSTVEVSVRNESGSVWSVSFTRWTAQVFDNYNWDEGKSVVVPGWGEINDEDALRVERAGRARSFLIESVPWQVLDQTIIGPARVSI